jgi:hypothetical protein
VVDNLDLEIRALYQKLNENGLRGIRRVKNRVIASLDQSQLASFQSFLPGAVAGKQFASILYDRSDGV